MRKADALPLTSEERNQLEAWAKGRTIQARLRERARILLLLAEGAGIRPAAKQLQVGFNTVRRWRDRFLELGCQSILHDAPGRGRRPVITAERRAEIVRMTTQEKPHNATHWSLSKMAEASGLSTFAVWKIWKANGLKPHLVRTFKVSNDPHFAEKVEDIVGLYLKPPEHAGWDGDCRHHAKAPASGMVEVSQADLPVGGQGQRNSYHLRQLRYPQDGGGAGLAGYAQARSRPLHTNQRILAQYGETTIPRHFRESCP